MESTATGQDVRRIERLAVEMALTFNWISLYQAGHPSLAGRVEKFHRNLAEVASEEPSGHLLLGVAKDKILYQNVFLGDGNSLVRSFTSELFLQQVATLDFSTEVTPRELLAFFLSLQQLRVEKRGGRLDEILKGEGVRGIELHPYNYKEVLSRKIIHPGGEATSSNREDELWRMILTENASSGDGGVDQPGDLPIPPEMIPAILRRVNAAADKGNRREAGSKPVPDAMSPETIRRVLARLGDALHRLPVEQKSAVIQSLDSGVVDTIGGGDGDLADADFVRTLTGVESDDEFLDLMATLLVAEKKSGNRIRKIFEVIATERNREGALLPVVQRRVHESVRTKNYYAQKAWEAIERLLLRRSEAAYIGQDHSHLLERLSILEPSTGGTADGSPQAAPAVTAEFEEENLRLKGAGVLLELLAEEKAEEEFLELLEGVRKIIPNLISRGELPLLKTVLSTLMAVHRNAPDGRKPVIECVVGELDFAHMIDLYLSPDASRMEKGRIEEILVSFVGVSIGDFLDRLLMETDPGNRKTLLSLAFRFDAEAVPAIRGKLDDPHWYFVRNLCLVLGRIGDPSVVPDLVRLLGHQDLRVRKEAVLALGQLRAPESIPFLGKILFHETLLQSAREESLRIDAANAIFRCGGTRGMALLHRGTECNRKKVREHCAALLGTMGTEK
ncbi:MAG: HEAT-like repeat-containing protein [Deltaproteobacteria bacterium]|nr:HEAT-like repeat-containing protein [Deltaproteobacteria bacterium]MBP2686014.1 HEAT-like repeat-containing protein [Deltaproteobacteria bacterium]